MVDLTDSPRIVIDLDIAETNSRKMAENLSAHGINWRPHIKTHKSIFFAQKQLEWGAKGITCAKIGEAEVMASAGIHDIYLAYPIIGEAKLRRYLTLSNKVPILRTLINSIEGARALGAAFAREHKAAEVLIEIDGGMGRGGVPLDKLNEFGTAIKDINRGLRIVGVASFCGNSIHIADEEERRAAAKQEACDLIAAKKILSGQGFGISILSGGSSVSSRYPDCLSGITESRAGTCIFNDMMHVALGTCKKEDCAAVVAATVVTLPQAGAAVIDAGSKTLSSDLCGNAGFGYVVEYGDDIVIEKLSEEHGIMSFNGKVSLGIGDMVSIIPNHICTVINLADSVVCKQKTRALFEVSIDARGRNA